MKPVVVKMPVPTMLEITSAVALKKPSCRNSPGLPVCIWMLGIEDLKLFYGLGTVANKDIRRREKRYMSRYETAPAVSKRTEEAVNKSPFLKGDKRIEL